MEPAVRPLDVCVHLPSRRRCLAVAVRPDGAVECVDGDDRRLVCRPWELVPYHDHTFDAASRRSPRARRRVLPGDHVRREQAHAAALRAAVAGTHQADPSPVNPEQ